MAKLTRKAAPAPARRRTRSEDTGSLFKRAVAKLTRRTSLPPSCELPPSDWEPLSWLRSWECDPFQATEIMVNEPVRSAGHIQESIFLASTLTGFML